MHEIWINTQIETSTHSMLEFISKRFMFDKLQDLQETLKYLTDYQNNIPRWTLKGNVPVALFKTYMPGGKSKSARPSSTPSRFPVWELFHSYCVSGAESGVCGAPLRVVAHQIEDTRSSISFKGSTVIPLLLTCFSCPA